MFRLAAEITKQTNVPNALKEMVHHGAMATVNGILERQHATPFRKVIQVAL